jgi:hypothetical protein
LTVDFLPVYRAVAELAESVMNESIEWVICKPKASIWSSCIKDWYFPLMDLWAIKRAAVIIGWVIPAERNSHERIQKRYGVEKVDHAPSPIKKRTFLAFLLLLGSRTTQLATVFA